MAVTYTWTIATCEHDIATGGINVVHWRCNAADGEFSASAYGTAGCSPDPSSPDYIPYADVTEADVLAWVYESVDKEATEAGLAAQIATQQNPTTANGNPWA